MNTEILNKYIELINKGYCEDCNELNCIGNFPHKEIAKAIEFILKENQELKNQQKEFIEYLENKISELNEITKNEEDEETIHYALVRITAINEILLTYKKIIGGKE